MPSRTIAHDDPEGQGLLAPNGFKWYMCHFAHKYLSFRTAELEAVAGMCGVSPDSIVWRTPPSTQPDMMPFWSVSLPSDEVAKQVTARTLLTKGLYEVWGEGSTWEELEQAVRAYPDELKEPWLAADRTFKVHVTGYGNTFTMKQQVEFLDKLNYIDFKGTVRMDSPEVVFWLKIVDISGTSGLGDKDMVPFRLYFGRKVSEYDHSIVRHYLLTKRPYIGPTSMDAEMAFVMCNQAQVQSGHLVFDPYVGTGSITVAAAHYGAIVMGSDIDVRVVKLGMFKKDKDGEALDVMSNFRHYGLAGRMADLLACDMHKHAFRTEPPLEEIYHSIIGDPPYGVRAGGRKSVPRDIAITKPATHIAGRAAYNLGECLRDLLDFSARYLVMGGRLVFFMPSTEETYSEEELPAHPALKIIYNSEQLLHKRYSRRLITMEKVCRYDAAAAAAFHALQPDPTMAIDKLHELVYEQYERDERGKVIYPDNPGRKWRGKKL